MPRGGYREGAGRKGGWKNSETQVIRVPKVFAGQLLDVARRLDLGESLNFSKSHYVEALDPIVGKIDALHPGQIPLFTKLDSVTESNSEINDSVTESKTPPNKPDGKRWLSSERAWNLAKERGCSRSLEGFRKWCKRHDDECIKLLSLRRLESIRGRTSAPAFEDLLYSDDSDCQDF